jgi:hypothetical protein
MGVRAPATITELVVPEVPEGMSCDPLTGLTAEE